MKNTLVISMIMKVTDNKDDEMEYISGARYSSKCKWWEGFNPEEKKIKVAVNGKWQYKENVLGYVKNFKKDEMNNIWCTMALNLSDPDDEMRLHNSIFCACLSNLKEEKGLLYGKIDSIALVHKKHYPYRMKGLAGFKIMGKEK